MGKLKKMDEDIPDHWHVQTDEIAAYVFRITAKALDGRRIEATGSDEEEMLRQVVASIRDSDRQVRDLVDARQKRAVV